MAIESARDMMNAYGGKWGENPHYPLVDWAWEVQNDDTRLGYWEWVVNQASFADERGE